jgi:hypothetical protein
MSATLVFEEKMAAPQSTAGSLDPSIGFAAIILKSHYSNPFTLSAT